jgi:hypothetical protein
MCLSDTLRICDQVQVQLEYHEGSRRCNQNTIVLHTIYFASFADPLTLIASL